MRPRPDPGVMAWLDQSDEDRLYMSVVSIAELGWGIALLAEGRRRDRLSAWLTDELIPRFEGRLLDISAHVAAAWGDIKARTQRHGFSLNAMDAFLASTAETHELIFVTRNVRHFSGLGIQLVNPW